MNLINNSIVFDKNAVNLFSYLHIYMHWEEFYRYIFTDIFSTDLQIEYRIFSYGDIVYWSAISIFIILLFYKGNCYIQC